MELRILKFNFLICSISGFWRPLHWTSKSSKLLYKVWTFVVLYLCTYVFLTHLMYFVFVVENIQQLASSIFLGLSIVNLWAKIITLIIRRDQIIKLIEIIQEKPCKPSDEEEINIQITYDHAIRSYCMPYIIMCTMSGINCILGGILYMLNGILPYGFAWVPWDCSSNLVFVITSLQEIGGIFIGLFVNVATETMMLGFCLQVCARFEILKHRIQKMIKQRRQEGLVTSSSNNTSNKRLSEYVSHHLYIIRLAEMINYVFNQLIFVQFTTSILILCTTIYHVLFHATREDIVIFFVYSFCMLVQIFYYCWSGNEITLKSTGFGDDVYNMDWIYLPISEQKSLLMIMKRSARPVKLTSSFLVTLSLESFSNLLKTSFSVFNLVQQF